MLKAGLLFSKEWCELVFENRNKEYGAYQLRATVGKRYRRAFICVLLFVFVFFILPLAAGLYMHYTILLKSYDEVQQLARLKPLDAKDNHEYKEIATGRRAIPNRKPDASMEAPEITEGQEKNKEIGLRGPEEFSIKGKTFVNINPTDTVLQNDTLVPITKEELTPTEVVEQMPQFPGGPVGMMKWLDENIIYHQRCIDSKIEGEIEVVFIVNEKGMVENARITKHLHPDLDNSVLYAVRRMPKWKPGRQDGIIKPVQVTIPVDFHVE